jgi:hypothetical protein
LIAVDLVSLLNIIFSPRPIDVSSVVVQAVVYLFRAARPLEEISAGTNELL